MRRAEQITAVGDERLLESGHVEQLWREHDLVWLGSRNELLSLPDALVHGQVRLSRRYDR